MPVQSATYALPTLARLGAQTSASITKMPKSRTEYESCPPTTSEAWLTSINPLKISS